MKLGTIMEDFTKQANNMGISVEYNYYDYRRGYPELEVIVNKGELYCSLTIPMKQLFPTSSPTDALQYLLKDLYMKLCVSVFEDREED